MLEPRNLSVNCERQNLGNSLDNLNNKPQQTQASILKNDFFPCFSLLSHNNSQSQHISSNVPSSSSQWRGCPYSFR